MDYFFKIKTNKVTIKVFFSFLLTVTGNIVIFFIFGKEKDYSDTVSPANLTKRRYYELREPIREKY